MPSLIGNDAFQSCLLCSCIVCEFVFERFLYNILQVPVCPPGVASGSRPIKLAGMLGSELTGTKEASCARIGNTTGKKSSATGYFAASLTVVWRQRIREAYRSMPHVL